jgi:hypothetical protein
MKRTERSIALILVLLFCGGGLFTFFGWDHVAATQTPSRAIDFNREIQPVLSDKCYACHGPDAPNKKIKLRLDSEAAATADLGRGRRAITPGQPDRSELVRRITAKDEAMRMPPVSSNHSLSQQEIESLTEWIRQGAKWGKHWAFVPPTRPAIPQVKNQPWVKNAIDSFVLKSLDQHGLTPSAEADRATLLRRLTFDLTGLPPTPAELDAFLSDASENAYEKVVDRLLASPRYGERMAFRWLDAARYADTNGYQIDGDRSAWRWRDWVIAAFNQNMPYDQFAIEQLAGDLLPTPTLDQKIATAFNRNHRLNAEGGIVGEEYRVEYVVDRVDTTSTVFMGLTLGCARCHNHKFDPFTQKEFYQLTAYFNSIEEDGHSFDQGNSPPWMKAPTADEQRRLAQFDQEIADHRTRYDQLLKKHSTEQSKWEKSLARGGARYWRPDGKLLVYLSMNEKGDEDSEPVFHQSERPYHDQKDRKKEDLGKKFPIGFKGGEPKPIDSPTGKGVAFDGSLYFDAGLHADFRYKSTSKDYQERFTIAGWIYPENEQAGSIVTKVSDNPAEIENNVPRAEGYGMYFLNGKIHFNMVFRWGEDTLRVETEDKLPLKQWSHVAVVFDGTKALDDRIEIFVDGKAQKLKFNQRSFYLLFGGSLNTLKIGAGGGPQFRFRGGLDEIRLYARALDAQEIAMLSNLASLERLASISPKQRSPLQALILENAFVAQSAPDDLKQERQNLIELQDHRMKYEDTIPTLMVMAETLQPRPTYVLKRGAYDAPGDAVGRGVPEALPAISGDLPNNRLGFARWLMSSGHPLAARVAVNRFWQMLFGVGLVKTSEDFGLQGALPSHPELLDWLAVEFTQKAWDVKSILKTIVMSATYRQSSKNTADLRAADPDNQWLARAPRFRMSAEMIRDQALSVSGLLVEKIGGPSVKPYQPDGLYKDMVFSALTKYAQAKGDGLWRRSLYTFWKRTVLSPTMQVFDASAREFCTVRDTRTNTPLQSLNLMNDVTYVEAARLLGQRMILEGGDTAESRLIWGFRLATSRKPAENEVALLLRDLNRQRGYYADHKKEASQLLTVGEKRNDSKIEDVDAAAYTAVASMILNLDETITRQ